MKPQIPESSSLAVMNAKVSLAPVVNAEVSPALVGEERLMAIAFSSKKIKEYSIKDVAHKVNSLITVAYNACGYKIDKKDQKLLVVEFAHELKTYFYTLTFDELDIAFYKGVRKEYGEYMGLSLVTFYGWVQSFMACSERMSAKRKQREYIDSLNAPPPPTPQEVHTRMMKSCIDMFNDFKNGKVRNSADIFDAGNVHYDFLDKLGLINFSDKKKRELYENAKLRLKTKSERELATATNSSFRKKLRDEIDSFEVKGNDVVKCEAKRVALETYFYELIQKEKEIGSVIPTEMPVITIIPKAK